MGTVNGSNSITTIGTKISGFKRITRQIQLEHYAGCAILFYHPKAKQFQASYTSHGLENSAIKTLEIYSQSAETREGAISSLEKIISILKENSRNEILQRLLPHVIPCGQNSTNED